MAQSKYVERILFIIGDQNTGKSTQLRSIFRDQRFGTCGEIPCARNIPETYPLSNERWFYLRLSSPHESGNTLEEFVAKCDRKMWASVSVVRRWNFAGALQMRATKQLPEGPREVIETFMERFNPNRVRAVILSPDRSGNVLDSQEIQILMDTLQELQICEVLTVDARWRSAHGLMYADFFDFT